jgi:hypothetical protein
MRKTPPGVVLKMRAKPCLVLSAREVGLVSTRDLVPMKFSPMSRSDRAVASGAHLPGREHFERFVWLSDADRAPWGHSRPNDATGR